MAAVARRWPSLVALPLGIDSFFDDVTGSAVHGFATALLVLPLLYFVQAVLRQRRSTWPVLVVLLGLLVALRAQDRVEPSVVLLAVVLAVTIWGTAHGRHREREFRVQLAGMLGFGALAVAGLLVDPDLGRYVVAAGWLAHGVWDLVHLARNRVVARSFAEWCAVLDLLIGAALIAVPML